MTPLSSRSPCPLHAQGCDWDVMAELLALQEPRCCSPPVSVPSSPASDLALHHADNASSTSSSNSPSHECSPSSPSGPHPLAHCCPAGHHGLLGADTGSKSSSSGGWASSQGTGPPIAALSPARSPMAAAAAAAPPPSIPSTPLLPLYALQPTPGSQADLPTRSQQPGEGSSRATPTGSTIVHGTDSSRRQRGKAAPTAGNCSSVPVLRLKQLSLMGLQALPSSQTAAALLLRLPALQHLVLGEARCSSTACLGPGGSGVSAQGGSATEAATVAATALGKLPQAMGREGVQISVRGPVWV